MANLNDRKKLASLRVSALELHDFRQSIQREASRLDEARDRLNRDEAEGDRLTADLHRQLMQLGLVGHTIVLSPSLVARVDETTVHLDPALLVLPVDAATERALMEVTPNE